MTLAPHEKQALSLAFGEVTRIQDQMGTAILKQTGRKDRPGDPDVVIRLQAVIASLEHARRDLAVLTGDDPR